MLIKTAPSLKDPNRDSNQKHTTVNEIMNETVKRKQSKFKANVNKQFMNYEPGQYERIFNGKTKEG